VTSFVVNDPTEAEIRYVVMNLREKSREDLFTTLDATPKEFADALVMSPGLKWAIYCDNRPAVLMTADQVHKGVWSVYGMGTDDWIKVWRRVTSFGKRDMIPAILDAGGHRGHTVSPAWHEDTHKWLRYMGFNHEAPMPKYGPNGEDYILFSWLKE